ncbi:MAG: sugar nucleotide-binding protein [Pseudomonadota bacterium]|nr:sugar nucleotide-binding protein [Pseudomonadota bacterium]
MPRRAAVRSTPSRARPLSAAKRPSSSNDATPLALWVGPEATVNRVGEDYFDEIEATGFAEDLADLDRLASLGAKRIRFPVLWERTAPRAGSYRWDWSDARLARLQELGLAPIVGLVHHGSGPRDTNLLDPLFAAKLATYARAVAERYPWVDAWTPVNEPVTTARFAGLYGHWYPHKHNDASFVRAVLNQIRGVVLAMRAVREVNPQAQLVQTDDLGFVQSTLPLRYQASFENSRRWLSFDLLTGRVDRDHPLWRYLQSAGATRAELMWFCENRLPPDIIGINVYVTSERFLDHRLDRYPAHMHGGNRRDAYVDVEAVRVLGQGIGGFAARLAETHARYGLPIAITEAHLACTREEQLRWLMEAWRAAEHARHAGMDVRAVTFWAAVGAVDWNSLVTCRTGRYEPGLWDTRAATPRPTAMAKLARELSHGEVPTHPTLAGPGWWRRDVGLLHPVHGPVRESPVRGRPILITGASGTLGRAFARLCHLRGLAFHLTTRADLDIARPASVRAAIARWQPWAIINTAGYVRVDDAEADVKHWRDNVLGPTVLASASAREGIRLVTFSSDLVFDGSKGAPYVESDRADPLNAYGRGKRAAELEVLAKDRDALVVRTSAFFGPWDRYNFVAQALAALRQGERWRAANDQWVSPTYVPDLVHATLDLLVDGESGVWHLANRGEVTWASLAQLAADAFGLNASLIEPVAGAELGQVAARPRFAALASERGSPMPTLEQGLQHLVHDLTELMRDEASGGATAAESF